jgi:hypothetical protein
VTANVRPGADDMVCHMCGAPASYQCPWLGGCQRYVCTSHTVRYYSAHVAPARWPRPTGQVCQDCADKDVEYDQSITRKYYWCDFCDAAADNMTEICVKCRKRFCNKHGRKTYGQYSDRHSYWVRCNQHMQPELTLLRMFFPGKYDGSDP